MPTYTDYPKAATENAKRALKFRDETDNLKDCGTPVGWARANQLAKREPISLDTVKRMAQFNRHKQNKDVPYDVGCGGLMWDAWGGDEGINWAIRKVEQVEREQENAGKYVFKAELSEITIDAPIDDFFGANFEQMRTDLAGVEDVKLTINSPGGLVTEGFAIADALRDHGQNYNVEIVGTGIVASIATMIFAAGTPGLRKMTANAFMMIHDPTGETWGNADDMRSSADVLDQMKDRLIANYVQLIASNGKLINGSVADTKAKVAEWMSKETWFSAERALEVGLIDGIINADEYITEANVQAVEARMRTFSNPPMAIMNSIQKIKASMQNEIEKPEVKTSLLDKIVNAITSVFKAQTNEGHEEEEEKEEEAIVENSENSDNMTKEEMIEALKAAGYEVKSMEEEKEEKKEEEMTEEEMIAALEEAGMKVKKEATNEVVAEQTNEMDSKFAEMQEEIARLKALANKPKIEQKAQKEEAPVDARTAMLERIAERCKVPMNQLNEGIKGFF